VVYKVYIFILQIYLLVIYLDKKPEDNKKLANSKELYKAGTIYGTVSPEEIK